MSTPSPALERFPRVRKLLLTLLALVAFALIAVAGTSLWFYVSARRALPQLDGQISVPGVVAQVIVRRDAHGVPAIDATSLEDLFFAQGYVTAQDRLWQMDMTRRYASGRLAEVLGSKMLKSDIRQRTLLMPLIAERAAAELPARDRAFFEAYARGVNAYIDSHRNSLPIEFHVLHYSPQPWTVVDSMLVGASMSEMLNLETLESALSREAITEKLGPELAADLYPNSSFRDHPPVPDATADEIEGFQPTFEEQSARPHRRVGLPHIASLGAAGPWEPASGFRSTLPEMAQETLAPGSNNWVVSGARTASGKPLLSNDMHLPHQIPNTWYEIHLTSGGFDVAGVSLPGVPFIIVGHNRRIAWGFTNIGPAVTDFYVENVNSDGQYQTAAGWKPLEHRRETIRVRWGKDVSIDVAITRHGPIVSNLIPGEKRTLALKWVLFDPAASQVPFFDINSAGNWTEFRQAFSRFGSPSQNVVYADVDGHIGYQATGFVPVRPWTQNTPTLPAKNTEQQTSAQAEIYTGFPLAGADNAHEWSGYIPYEKLPSVFDPPEGVIATANGRITPRDYPYVVSMEWGPPYRTERIYRFLNSENKLTPADMLALQNDIYSEFDRFCAERFVYAVDRQPNASDAARRAAEIMRRWDGRVDVDSSAATIVAVSRRELVRLLLEPRLGSAYADYRWFMSSVWLENLLLTEPARWLPNGYTEFNALLADAVEKALKRTPKASSKARWGNESPVYLQHALFGRVPFLNHWSGPGLNPQSGNGYTVKQVGRGFGPSERMTVDFSNLDNSTLNIVTGQSGNVFSPYYLDQWKSWYSGTTLTLPYSPDAVQKSAAHILKVQPN